MKRLDLESHKLYVGEVVGTNVDEGVMDAKGNIDFAKTAPFVWNDFEYCGIEKRVASGSLKANSEFYNILF